MTIRQIAELYGVAPSTVSVVLNNRPGVRKEMRDKLEAALIENGYTIKNKKNEHKGSILFIYYKSTDYLAARKDNTLSSILLGLEEVCAQNNYSFALANATPDTIDQVLASASDEHKGIVFLGTEYYDQPGRCLLHAEIPLVILDAFLPEHPLNSVNMNNSYGIHQAISLLAENGHRQIGYLKSRLEFGCLRDRANCIYSSMHMLGLDSPCCVIPVSQESTVIQEEIRSWIDSGADVPTAFIADNDTIAVSSMQVLQEKGYRIPDDISIIGFDDSEICTIIQPHLTTLRANLKEMARQAAHRLVTMIEDRPGGYIQIEVGTELIQRQSVGQAKQKG